ncbi:MAG: hypothetical protein ACLFWF_02390 [Alphaproteobacteria bacterium]
MIGKSPWLHLPAAAMAAALGAWLAGSAWAAPIVTRTGTTPFYSPNVIMMAKQDGGLPAQVYGSPSRGVTPAAAIAPLRLPATVGGGRIIPMAGGEAARTRLVLVFNSEDVSPEQACEAPSSIRERPVERGLEVYAVLCRGNRFFSHARLRDEAVGGIRDRRYRDSMEQLLLALMPPEDRADDELD